jgi:hypothetical protein
MPYEIIKCGKGYNVQNVKTKQIYSKKPLSKMMAIKQKFAIEISERNRR